MRILLTGIAALMLAGCRSPAPAPATNDASQPNEAMVEGDLQNEQANQAQAIENDALNDSDDVDTD